MIPSTEIIALEDRYGSGIESKQPLVLVRGEGARIWDAEGRVSPWSAPARWEMGLLEPGDWAARWVAEPEAARAFTQDPQPGAQWIWHPDGDPLVGEAAADRCHFRLRLELPNRPICRARMLLAADNALVLTVNGLDAH